MREEAAHLEIGLDFPAEVCYTEKNHTGRLSPGVFPALGFAAAGAVVRK